MSFKSYMTSTDLIESVQRKIAFPISQNTFSNEDILHFANEEMMISMVPQILSFHEEFFVWSEYIPFVSGRNRYPIPARAIGMKLRDLFYKDNGNNIFEMTRIDPSNKDYYQRNLGTDQNIHKYYFENNDVVLTPLNFTQNTGGLLMQYFIRPNQLVLNDYVAIITKIEDHPTDGLKTILTFDKIPTNITGGIKVDILQTEGGHKLFNKDVLINQSDISGFTITFNKSDLSVDMVVGDYIAEAGQCIIPMIPDDLHSGLAERICARILSSLGDMQGLQASQAKINDIEYRQGNIIDNRNDGSPTKIFSRHSLLRYNKARYRRF